MLDLVPDSDIGTTYLEPACGNGNFLAAILQRKLDRIPERIGGDSSFRLLFTAVSSVYGVDIQDDNVKESRERLNKMILTWCSAKGIALSSDKMRILRTVLRYNIICGNTLAASGKNGPLLFSEWMIRDGKVEQKEYSYADMIEGGGASEKCVGHHTYRFSVAVDTAA
jgi:hypothetical protein